MEYPDHLSRGLVLVKWWLLAIPHYVVVGIFVGGGWYVVSSADGTELPAAGVGLIDILVLVAAVVLLFTGRYPQPVFDLVLGLNRWVLRVAAYASLMTDTYPPFRLDLGGNDPGSGVIAVPAPEPKASEAATTSGGPGHIGAGRATAVVLGSLLGLVALGLLAGSAMVQFADKAVRDDDGYLMSSTVNLESPGYAVTSGSAELNRGPAPIALPERWLGTVKVEAIPHTENGIFVGIARTADVDAYLTGVARSVALDHVSDDGSVDLDFTDGGSPPVAPTDAEFWAATAAGQGPQELTWPSEAGDWTLVVMNGGGTTPVEADVAIGATAPILDEVAIFLLIAGLVLGGLAVVVLYLALTGRSPGPEA